MNRTLREAQLAWDMMHPEDYSEQEAAQEEREVKAYWQYLAQGELPVPFDMNNVWEELGEDYAEIVCLHLLRAYRTDNDEMMLAIAKQLGEAVDSVVQEIIENNV